MNQQQHEPSMELDHDDEGVRELQQEELEEVAGGAVYLGYWD